jgi:transcription elongation GreA/GreB family factor
MSRAFVKDQDDLPEDVADRPISPNPNFVTARGLRLIDEAITRLRHGQAHAQQTQDKEALAHTARDLRYWLQRRTSAQLVEPPHGVSKVAFATRAEIRRADGRTQVYAIVGEDEADPAEGTIAYSSPLARALLGKHAGDLVEAPGGEVEIVGLEAVGPEG